MADCRCAPNPPYGLLLPGRNDGLHIKACHRSRAPRGNAASTAPAVHDAERHRRRSHGDRGNDVKLAAAMHWYSRVAESGIIGGPSKKPILSFAEGMPAHPNRLSFFIDILLLLVTIKNAKLTILSQCKYIKP